MDLNKETQQCFGINIIFLDDSNNRIHAFINTKYVDKLEQPIVEGEIYALSNFKVKKYLDDETYCAVRTDKNIFFIEHTKCEKDNNEGLQIEKYAFDIFVLEEIEKNANDNRFLFDVVGIVQNARPMVTTVKNGVETKRLMFDISDGRYNLKVTLFNEMGEAYETAVLCPKDASVEIIISAAKITTYDGAVNLTNYPATRVYVNSDHFYVPYLKNKLEDKSSWYYANCAKCKVEVFREGGRYKCTNCKRTIPHPDKRFRVCTICSDQTGSVGIFFPDNEVRRVIQKSVFDIHAEYIEEPIEEPFPNILRQLHHKDYMIKVLLSEENIINGSSVYEATSVDNAIERSDNFTPCKQITEKEQDMSIINDNQTPVLLKVTPQTGKSTNWKSRARKNNTPVVYDSDENVPAKASKNIKKEPLDPST
ncbi:hypothetical protein POM88_020779 [Heracleum sosnowskyi]|uniref:Replication protein A 70 kDa DNA-binding subunit B/D first OB fold domain-containing protein n=1 Tax=Heracleum sosnowskyi TaxID=360622 RepID=A0AAD8MSA2_9APIA|nr:hypothetical protein POM88_020779 [Heracleum sosnowskyi]